jgi:hypothetical protein
MGVSRITAPRELQRSRSISRILGLLIRGVNPWRTSGFHACRVEEVIGRIAKDLVSAWGPTGGVLVAAEYGRI